MRRRPIEMTIRSCQDLRRPRRSRRERLHNRDPAKLFGREVGNAIVRMSRWTNRSPMRMQARSLQRRLHHALSVGANAANADNGGETAGRFDCFMRSAKSSG